MKRLLATAAVLAALGTNAVAEDKIVVEFAYPYSHLFDVTYEKILPKFYEENPGIEIKMRATYESYEDGTNTILREAVSGDLPDVTMQGLNRQAILVEKGIAKSLEPFIAEEADFAKDGYHEAMLNLSTFDDAVHGLPFSISLPVGYYNMDILKDGGIEKLPTDLGRCRQRLQDHEGERHQEPDVLGLEHHRQLVPAGSDVEPGRADRQHRWLVQPGLGCRPHLARHHAHAVPRVRDGEPGLESGAGVVRCRRDRHDVLVDLGAGCRRAREGRFRAADRSLSGHRRQAAGPAGWRQRCDAGLGLGRSEAAGSVVEVAEVHHLGRRCRGRGAHHRLHAAEQGRQRDHPGELLQGEPEQADRRRSASAAARLAGLPGRQWPRDHPGDL